ncbi:MAG: phytoene/squalene synthase family protein [Methylocella sp.]
MSEPRRDGKQPDYAYCETLLRRDDPDRWLASLFLPEAKRPHVQALYAFSLEIARVREIVSEPMLGEIRFQWWRDALQGLDAGDVGANPVAGALLDAIRRFSLPKSPLIELIDARQFDLYDDVMESIEALDAYAKATSSSLFRLSPLILMGEETAAVAGAAEHAGIAYALTGLLRAFPWHSARGQVYVPLGILRRHGLEPGDITAGRPSPAISAALADLRNLARRHLEAFLTRIEGLPERCRGAFLPVSLCEPYLREMEKPGYNPFETAVALPQWRRQWILWRAAKRWA